MAYGDTLNYSIEGLNTMIGIFTQIKGEIEAKKQEYDSYITSTLAPNWNTTAGAVMLQKLRNFSENDLNNFIKYLDMKIENLEAALSEVKNIDNA